MTTSRIVALLGACLLVPSAQAALLAGWETTAKWGTQGLAASQQHADVTVGGLTRGSGVDTGSGASENGWGGEAWHAETYDDGIAGNRFITFTITPAAGFEVSIEKFTLHYRRSSEGPTAADLLPPPG